MGPSEVGPATGVSDDDVGTFRKNGFVVLRAAFDPVALGREVDEALARGFARAGATDRSARAKVLYRWLPLMTDRTPLSLGLLRRFRPAAKQLVGLPVLPVRAMVVEHHGGSYWGRDHDLAVTSVTFACDLEPLDGDTGALRVVPGSHRDASSELPEDDDAGVAVATEPGDVVVFDEHVKHSRRGGGKRRQWRVHYVERPLGRPAEEAVIRAYYAEFFSPTSDGGYDVDAFPTYGPDWRRACDPSDDALLDALGAYAAADAEEEGARRRRTPPS